MIIQSLRLKNVKSYGEGPDGTGVTITFQPGVNRVAGRNGHGKTTLIEALGYALFFSEPGFEERFALATYFLRSGEKEGEIEVVFTHNGLAYRIERGLGQGKRKTKITELSDGSTCAEGDEDVSLFLRRLLASEKHRFHDQAQLAELFSNLVGVKQGRLCRPFDSKPALAKEFFDPLLDVAIFRESTSRLNEAQGRFRDLLSEQQLKLAAVTERIRERQNSLQQVPLREAQVETLERALDKSRKQLEKALQVKLRCEQTETAFNKAKAARENAGHALKLATQKREADQQRLTESEAAAAAVKETEAAYNAFVHAEARLRVLQNQQNERSTLLQQRANALNARTRCEARRESAQKQIHDYHEQQQRKIKELEVLRARLADDAKTLQESRADFEKHSRTSAAARRSREMLNTWQENLDEKLKRAAQILDTIANDCKRIRDFNGDALKKARAEEKEREKAARELGRALAKAEEWKATLTAQLAQINGGMCPFLKEPCRQFDPKAVQSDLTAHEKQITRLITQHEDAQKVHEEATDLLQKLTQKENEAAHLKERLEERLRGLAEHEESIFPKTLQTHLTMLRGYAPVLFRSLPEFSQPSPQDFLLRAEGLPDVDELRRKATARHALFSRLAITLTRAQPELDTLFDQFEKTRQDRVGLERDLQNTQRNLERVENEHKDLGQKHFTATAEATRANTEFTEADQLLARFDSQLKTFAHLDTEWTSQQALKDAHTNGHKQYLGAKPLAERLEERRNCMKGSLEAEEQTRTFLKETTSVFEQISREFDSTALEKARNDAAALAARTGLDEKALQTATRELKQEQERWKQWKEACAEQDTINNEIGRLTAAGNIARLAGRVLRDAAPAVAQHLCSRIAAAAQRIYNRINPDPIELEWKAEPQYSLRITPGDRRFAMLSGGEQTKLALAMTLAMIEQFSGLRFAVFDEPTYGIDLESRERLADAIISAQQAAGLDQLILVSHDGAFEGKLEHVIMLNKKADSGTELVTTA